MRRFILVPAAEVAPDIRDPVTGNTVAELASALATQQTTVAVIAARGSSAMTILEESARVTGARLDQSVPAAPCEKPNSGGRTLYCICDATLESFRELPACNLVVYLTPPIAVEGALWEDYHRRAAEWLNLCESTSEIPQLKRRTIAGGGARYLLASDTPSWATHEIVAAFQAIDCPVEKLP